MKLADTTWPDVGDHLDDDPVALVPLGSTEQHGPHLPEGTDHFIAEAFARAACDRTDAIVTPTIPIGMSRHHRQFPGTLSASPAAFRAYVESITRSIADQGIRRVVYVNAHGGNVDHLREVGHTLRNDEVCYAIEWMWNESIPDLIEEAFENPGPHGGPKETALIQHLHPDLVHEDRIDWARDEGLVEVEASVGRVHGARTFYDSIDNTASGVLGDQTQASAEIGERLFEAASDELVALVEWLADQPFDDLVPHEFVRGRDASDR
ncbi:creatininase family protein [Halococcoides cellulosivorans]|uniref:Amidase n=1 Tax=Halococcoides cellulosivorans TaxID=1679096 RepID=A0A2R4WZQ1_9EURY|nr:creatininase family protein [Halococcoides cellulosivorans]AWB26985.1 amidase [Halococcoides cellulosivorans]